MTAGFSALFQRQLVVPAGPQAAEDILVSGVGPVKAGIVWHTRSPTLDGLSPQAHFHVGAFSTQVGTPTALDGSLGIGAGGHSQDNQATSQTVRANLGAMFILANGTGGVNGTALCSPITDGFTISYTNGFANFPVGMVLNGILMGGDSFVHNMGRVVASAVQNGKVVVTTGFRPEQILILASGLQSPLAEGDSSVVSIGLYDDTTPYQGCLSYMDVDAAATTDVREFVSAVDCAYVQDPAFAASRYRVVDVTATGFSLETMTVTGGTLLMYMAWSWAGEVNHAGGTIVAPSTTGDKDETTLGIKPQTVFQLQSFATGLEAETLGGNASALAVGAVSFNASSTEIEACAQSTSQDNKTTSNTQRGAHSNAVTLRNGAQVDKVIAHSPVQLSNGWRLTYDKTLAVPRLWPTIVMGEPVFAADFTGTPLSGAFPLTVQFTDASIGAVATWAWDFGDGGTSTLQSPAHTYTAVGSYTVTLTTTGPGGPSSKVRTNYVTVVEPPPVAAFVGAPVSGPAALSVQFTDQSTGAITSWAWDFGDTSTSSLPSPSHSYASTGLFTVKLTVTGPGGADTLTRTDYIAVVPTTTGPQSEPEGEGRFAGVEAGLGLHLGVEAGEGPHAGADAGQGRHAGADAGESPNEV